jgi:hypothetical protein
MPPRIDKGYLDNYSGGTQAILVATLKGFGLIENDGSVTSALKEIAISEDARKKKFREILDEFYPEQLALARKNGTSTQLEESFRKWKFKGSTLRKAIVFYLELVKYTGAPNSDFFKAPRQAPVSSTKKRTSTKRPEDNDPKKDDDQNNDGGSKRFVADLGDLGSVTLILAVKWWDLDDELIDAVRAVRKSVQELEGFVEENDDEGEVV